MFSKGIVLFSNRVYN